MTLTQALLLPIFVHVLLTTFVGVRTIRARIATVVSGETRLKDIRVDNNSWPDRVRALGNNFDNQFDLPIMWYACCALLLATGFADWVGVGLSWLFVAARLAHTLIHTGSNHVPTRMRVFLAGFGIVFAMWAWFAIRLFVTG